MKKEILGLLVIFSFGSCEKTIEKKQEDAVMDAITSGYWLVTQYTKGTTNKTTDFSGYKFQFKKNNTVDALKNQALEQTGQWEANAVNRTINAQFLNATAPLISLNGTWTITQSTWTSVDATQTIDGENCRLLLKKE